MIFDGPILAWFALALVPIILPVGVAVLLSRVFHVKSGCLPLLLLVLLGVISAYAITAYLNSTGKPVSGELLEKKESIAYHLDGSWNRKMEAEVRYRTSETALPITRSLDLSPAKFDELNQGDFVTLRCSSVPGVFAITRFEDQTVTPRVWHLVEEQPFLLFFGLSLILVLAAGFVRQLSLPTLFYFAALSTIGAWWISSVAIPLWQQASLFTGSLDTVNANVREVHPPYLGNGLQGWFATKVFTPYDLVLVDLIPLGHSQPVLSVDMVDIGSTSLQPGQSLNLQYSAENPRSALIPDATRSWVWKNGLLNTLLAAIVIFGVVKIASVLEERRTPVDAADRGRP
jgi:hypothetical protein